MATEQDDLVSCLDCGELVSPVGDRVYAVGCEDVLCMTCSLARGGAYDEVEDRWVVVPRFDDLAQSAEAHAH